MAELYSRPVPITELLDYGDIEDEPSVMSYRSETVFPIETSSRTARFRLEPFGYLGGESMLTFKMQGSLADPRLRANVVSGGLAAIKTARLQVGDTVIIEQRDFHLSSMADLVVKKDRDSLSKYHSHYWGCAFQTTAVTSDASGPKTNEDATAGQVVMDTDKCGIKFPRPGGTDPGAVQSQAITNDKDSNYQVGIRLGELFPVLDTDDFPLFLFDQYRIHIFLEFNDASVFVNSLQSVSPPGDGNVSKRRLLAAGGTDGTITYEDRKLQIDYKIFPSAVLDADRAKTEREGGLQLTFYDSKMIEKQVTGDGVTAGNQQSVELRLGLQGTEVHEISMLKRLVDDTDKAGSADMELRNQSLLLDMTCNTAADEEYQVDVNGIPSFPFFMKHFGSKYNRMREAKAHDLFMERPFFYGDTNDLQSQITTRAGGLQGTYSPLCVDLRNGMPMIAGGGTIIGQYPVVWKFKRTPRAATTGENNAQNGTLDVVFLCKITKQAVIRSSQKGMLVTVREQV